METTQNNPKTAADIYVSNGVDLHRLVQMEEDAARIRPEILHTYRFSGEVGLVKVTTSEGSFEGLMPDEGPYGLWVTKVIPHDAKGHEVKRVMIPWLAIRQIEVLAALHDMDSDEQPF